MLTTTTTTVELEQHMDFAKCPAKGQIMNIYPSIIMLQIFTFVSKHCYMYLWSISFLSSNHGDLQLGLF